MFVKLQTVPILNTKKNFVERPLCTKENESILKAGLVCYVNFVLVIYGTMDDKVLKSYKAREPFI